MARSETSAGPAVAKRRLAASSSAPTTSSRPKGRLTDAVIRPADAVIRPADAVVRPHRLRRELEDKLFRPANDVARPDQILLGHHGVGKAAEDRADHGLQLEAGERAAEAHVGTPSECEVLTSVGSGDVDLVRRRAKALLVPISRRRSSTRRPLPPGW